MGKQGTLGCYGRGESVAGRNAEREPEPEEEDAGIHSFGFDATSQRGADLARSSRRRKNLRCGPVVPIEEKKNEGRASPHRFITLAVGGVQRALPEGVAAHRPCRSTVKVVV
jgi:hypothetical protein